MKKMELNSELENLAQQWASRCIIEHGNIPNNFNGSIGQNIFWSTNRDGIVTDAIKLFYNEYEDYDFNRNSCTPGKICGHYTQVLWAKSYQVGCAVSVSKCSNNSKYYRERLKLLF